MDSKDRPLVNSIDEFANKILNLSVLPSERLLTRTSFDIRVR